jgi:hypothetical protein
MAVRFQLISLGCAHALTQAGNGTIMPEDFTPLRWM